MNTEASTANLILLADDDPNDLFLTRRLLGKAGLTNPVVTFRDGEELVAFLRPMAAESERTPGVRPRIVFLDLKMPRLDGFEVLRWIRSQKRLQHLPVVILSGSEEARDIKLATELGATAYLAKHPSPEMFARVVAEHAGRA